MIKQLRILTNCYNTNINWEKYILIIFLFKKINYSIRNFKEITNICVYQHLRLTKIDKNLQYNN